MTIKANEESSTAIKRGRKQSKITDIFNIGRSTNKKLGKPEAIRKSLSSSPISKRKKEFAKFIEPHFDDCEKEEINEKQKIEHIVGSRGNDSVAVKKNPLPESQITIDNTNVIKSEQIEDPYTLEDLPSVPAYLRYSHLLSESPQKLPLPSHFKHLVKILSSLDSICMLNCCRGQPVIFHKVIGSLEDSTGKRVELSHLNQLQGLFYDTDLGNKQLLYNLRQQKTIYKGKKIDTVSINLSKNATHEFLFDRRTELIKRLTKIIIAKHTDFLASQKIKLSNDDILKRFHPKFDIENVSLPDYESVIHVEKSIDGFKKTPSAILEAIEKSIPDTPKSQNNGKISEIADVDSGKKSKLSVLERIKAKQLEKESSSLLLKRESESKAGNCQEFIKIAEIISQLFVASKKTSLLLGDVISKMNNNNLSKDEKSSKIRELIKIVPKWLTIKSNPIQTLNLVKSQNLAEAKQTISQHFFS